MKLRTVLALGGSLGRLLGGASSLDLRLCASSEEVRAELAGSRRWEVALLDSSHPGADRDLIADALRSGCRVLIVDDGPVRDWPALGAHAVVPRDAHAVLREVEAEATSKPVGETQGSPLVAVTGAGGTGASTVAVALAQGLGQRLGDALLLDLSRDAEQHVLHGLAADLPGFAELVEAHRSSSPAPDVVRALARPAEARGYWVLGGLRRSRAWSSLRPAAIEAALATARSAFDLVVCDTDAELEGAEEGGSVDVEERNAMARAAFARAALSVAVGMPGVKGTHSLLRVLAEMWSHGVEPASTLVVLNRAGSDALERTAAALDQLGTIPSLSAVPESEVEPALLAGLPLPPQVVSPLIEPALGILGGPESEQAVEPVKIAPGSLGVRPSRG